MSWNTTGHNKLFYRRHVNIRTLKRRRRILNFWTLEKSSRKYCNTKRNTAVLILKHKYLAGLTLRQTQSSSLFYYKLRSSFPTILKKRSHYKSKEDMHRSSRRWSRIQLKIVSNFPSFYILRVITANVHMHDQPLSFLVTNQFVH